MAKSKSRASKKQHSLRNKLLFNQWLLSLFGIDLLAENPLRGKKTRPFHLLVDTLKHLRQEGRHPSVGPGKGWHRLLRNMSRSKGVGFFKAGNFHPDFILWMLVGDKQYVTFIEPHGMLHEGPASEKVLFHKRIKGVEQRLKDPSVMLNSFILSWTRYPQLKWDNSQNELEEKHVLFMTNDRDRYIDKLFEKLRGMVK